MKTKAKNKKIIIILGIIFMLSFLLLLPIVSHALQGDGNSINPGGNSGGVSSGGFNVLSTLDSANNGYRFTLLERTSSSFTCRGSIDVYESSIPSGYDKHIKATINGDVKRNVDKYTYKNKYANTKIAAETLSAAGTNYKYKTQGQLGITLPTTPKGMESWGLIPDYLNPILAKLGTSTTNLTQNNYILIEPIFPVKIANVGYSITETEIALLGCSLLGESSTGNHGSGYDCGVFLKAGVCHQCQ